MVGKLTVTNKLGLHARAAALVVRTAAGFASNVLLSNGEREVSAKSIMGLMMLAATSGTILNLRVEGPDAEDAFNAIEDIFNQRFGEDE